MAIKLSDIKQQIQDDLVDSGFVSDRQSQILRAINNTLKEIDNKGAFSFQLEMQMIDFNTKLTGTTTGSDSATILIDSSASFTGKVAPGDVVKNTTDGSTTRVKSVDSATQITCFSLADGTDNTFQTGDSYEIETTNYSLDSSYKAPYLLTKNEDENQEFEFVDPRYFQYKDKVLNSSHRIYSVAYKQGNWVLMINWDTSERLVFEYFSHNMVLDEDGSTRKTTFVNDNDTLLIPDDNYLVVVNGALYRLFKQLEDINRSQKWRLYFEEYKIALEDLKNEYGMPIPQPVKRMKVRPIQRRINRTLVRGTNRTN